MAKLETIGRAGALAALALSAGSAAWAQAAPAAPAPAAQPTRSSTAARPRAAAPVKRSSRSAAADEAADTAEASEVVVPPERAPNQEYGAVVGDIAPELQMTPSEVQSYGVSTVTELLNEIAPQTRSDRGRGATQPVVLLNGRRISSLNEVANIPTEAILRVDILPEEVALKYGYTADQRVVNIVLKRRFRAVTGEVSGGETTEGGDPTGQAEVDQFQVRRDTRTNIDIKYQAAGGLTDAQRDLVEPQSGTPFDFTGNVVSPAGGEIDPGLSALVGQPVTIAGVPAGVSAGQRLSLADFVPTAGVANVTDTAADHSLLPATQNLTANAVFARPVFLGINATINATLTGTSSDALQGLPGVSLLVPAGDPFSPFAEPVSVDRYLAGQSPLRQSNDGWTGRLGLTLNRDLGDWRLSLTTAYAHAEIDTTTGVGLDATALQAALAAGSPSVNPFGPLSAGLLQALPPNQSRQVSDGGNIQVLANGPLVKLPAGPLYVSAKLGDAEASVSSSSEIRGFTLAQTLARNDMQGLLNFDLPIASRRRHVLGALGDLSLNANTAVDDYSDFGPLLTLGYGVNWTPIPGYSLIVSETHDHLAPTIAQLEGPIVATPGVRVFDFATGQTATVTQITGGNPALQADDRQVMKIGLTLKPWPKQELTFTANYVDSHIANWIGALPAATAAIQAAFPDRFVRNADGDLVAEDDRTLNFASQDRTELRWGINFSMPVGKQPPPRPAYRGQFRRRDGGTGGEGGGGRPGGRFAGPPGGAPGDDEGGAPGAGPGGPDGQGGPGPGGGLGGPGGAPGGYGGGGHGGGYGGGGYGGGAFGGGRGGRGGGGFDGPPVGGRFQFALYHTIIFTDRYLVAPGGPVLDLLGGAPVGNAGGQYQHEVEAQVGYVNDGYGARLSADWRSATTVTGGAAGSTGTLDFSDVATVNLRLWDDFSQQRALITRYPGLRGVRLTLNVTNLFNQSIQVRDSAGPTPFNYQSAILDPTGRVISLNLRKVFY
jgi:iron complex outermembrane recepter protein